MKFIVCPKVQVCDLTFQSNFLSYSLLVLQIISDLPVVPVCKNVIDYYVTSSVI